MLRATRWLGLMVAVAVAGGCSAPPEDPQAAYERRADTMRTIGRALFTTIGNAVRGTTGFGPATAAAADQLASLAPTLPTLFSEGSILGESNLKPELFAQRDRANAMIARVQADVAKLVPVVKGGDPQAIAPLFKETSDACSACHSEFRAGF